MIYNGLDMTQVNNGLEENSACASAIAYDKANGLIFLSYMTGEPKHYSETGGKICLSVFSPSQPHNARYRTIDALEKRSRGLLCNAIYMIGDKKARIVFTDHSRPATAEPGVGDFTAAFYRDYDFTTDTVSPRTEMLFRTKDGDKRLNATNYCKHVNDNGYEFKSDWSPIVNSVTSYNGELYTAVTLDYYDYSYAVLCKIEDNVLVPFAICPEKQNYEFRYFVNAEGIFAAFRVAPDDHGTGHGGYTVSKDGGKTWNTTVYEDGVQSRHNIIEYYGKPLYMYNYKSDKAVKNFPRMHNFRNAVKFVYDGEVVLDLFSKHGFVEHDAVSICGDVYFAFSNCPQALSTENNSAWTEDNTQVEQGKEALQWMRLGNLIDNRKK
ncbi:MAG: hypothetical protein IKV54_00005 [Clostridia bacterium]|nr:hypothetical protein [Clostridia bacterium]